MDFTIHPGQGVGPLRFGMTRDEAFEVLGRPDQELEEAHDEDVQLGWHYETLGLSLYFAQDTDYRLGLIELDALEASVFGRRPIGLEPDEAEKVFGDHGLVFEENFPAQHRCVYELGDTSISFWFQDGFCESVQVAVPIGDDDEYVWPAG